MSRIKVYGSGEIAIYVEGETNAVFEYDGRSEGTLLAFSDGTVLRVLRPVPGLWRIRRWAGGSASCAIEHAREESGPESSDVATLDGDLDWVVQVASYAVLKH